MSKTLFNEKVGLCIAYHRKIKKIKQKEMADIMGISKARQSRIENGKAKIEAYIVLKYAFYFQISIEDLMSQSKTVIGQ